MASTPTSTETQKNTRDSQPVQPSQQAQEMSTRPRIGSFTRPAPDKGSSNPDVMTSASKSSAEPDVDSAYVPPETPEEKEAKQRLALYGDMTEMVSPVKDYRKYLEEIGVDVEEASRIVDDIMTKGFYEEAYSVTKLSQVYFRTRTHSDTLRLQAAMQMQRPVYQDNIDELMIRYNMAASLSRFKTQIFQFPNYNSSQTTTDHVEKMFDERLRYIERMPSPLFARSSYLLAQFDRKIAAIMREGVAENF